MTRTHETLVVLIALVLSNLYAHYEEGCMCRKARLEI